MLEVVWRNPQPPARRTLRITEVRADESREGPTWIIFYHTINDKDWPENAYQLLVKRNAQSLVAVSR
jgi:hypothetical protein